MTDSKNWSLYIIRTVDNQLYTGITTDVKRRVSEHFSSGRKAARYFKAHHPYSLVFHKLIGIKSLAYKVEYHFKRLRKAVKEDIVKRKDLQFDPRSGTVILE